MDPKSQGYINPTTSNGVPSEYYSMDTTDSKYQSMNSQPPISNGQSSMAKLEHGIDTMKLSQISTGSSKSAPEHNVFGKPFVPQPVTSMPLTPTVPVSFSNASSTAQQNTTLKTSAFKPYSMTSRSQTNNAEKVNFDSFSIS